MKLYVQLTPPNGTPREIPNENTHWDANNFCTPEKLIADGRADMFSVFEMQPTDKPAFDPLTEKVEASTPILLDGQWVQQWVVVAMTDEEKAAVARAIQNDIVSNTQKRLDDFARTRNYDGILSLCTYATSTTPKFQQEGQYGVNARDTTWATLYQILAEVEAGTRPMPTGYADIEPLLPALEWPQ